MALSDWNLSFMRKYCKYTQNEYSRHILKIKFVDFVIHVIYIVSSHGLYFFESNIKSLGAGLSFHFA